MQRTAAEVARAVADALERQGLPYAVGGAIALGFYTAPRATIDVDVNVFVAPAEGFAEVLAALRDGGFAAADEDRILRAQACADGQFRGTVEGIRVDVFVPAVPFYAQLATRKQQVILLGRPLWILGPEDLVVLKLMFFRRKDLADVEAILRDRADSLDRSYVRRTLIDLVGSDDERVRSLDDLERELGLPRS